MTAGVRARPVIWIAVALFGVAVAGIAGWLLDTLGRNAERQAAAEALAVARGAETTLNRAILDLDLLLAGLGELPGVWGADGTMADVEAAARTLRVLADQRLLVRDIVLVDADGRVVAAADQATRRLGVDPPEGFLADVAGQRAPQLLISRASVRFGTGEKVIYVARPVGPSRPGRLLALAIVPVSELTAILTPAVPSPGLWVTLESEQGELLASVPALDSRLGRALALPAMPALTRADEAPAVTTGRLYGEPAFVSMRPTLYSSMRVLAGIGVTAARASVHGERRSVLAVGASFIAVALALGALAQAWMSRLTAATAAAQGARETLEHALAAVAEGFLLWDADERVVTWNERYLALFPHLRPIMRVGVGRQEIAETAARAFLPDGTPDEWRAWMATRRAVRLYDGEQFEQRLPDGRIVVTAERRTATGGVVAVYHDVTHERRAAEELGRARRNAEAANEAKSRFLATMSHEIRTPLNGVLGMNGLLLETRLDSTQRHYADTIRRSGEALLAIIDDVLDMSRLEAGQVRLATAPFDPAALVDDVAAMLRPRADDKRIALDVEHADGLPARLDGDAGRVRQVLLNLVGNAVKFTERGGVRVLSTHRALDDGGFAWTLAVHDTGIGIPETVLPTLFQRFTQADDRITRQYGGSGLGLAITRELVELMGGTIKARSVPGQGSVFTVRLPLAPSAATAPAPTPAATQATLVPPAGQAPRRILVVEDNHVNQMLMTAMLDQLGHQCDIVGNGRAALAQVQRAPYDLVLMDLQMPEMDGVTAAREIRRLSGPVAQVPIVAVSANVLPEHRAACLEVGMAGLVPKPIDLGQLARSISEATA